MNTINVDAVTATERSETNDDCVSVNKRMSMKLNPVYTRLMHHYTVQSTDYSVHTPRVNKQAVKNARPLTNVTNKSCASEHCFTLT